MGEEKDLHQAPSAGENGPEPSAPSPKPEDKPLTRGQQKRRQRSVFQYITILFAAAFLLLLYSFMMERRQYESFLEQNQEQLEEMQANSTSATQRLQDILAQRDQLTEEKAALEQEVARLEEQITGLSQSAAQQDQDHAKALQAMDLFWQIDEAYVRGRYSLCRELILRLEDKGLMEALPKESTTDNGRFSPYDRYQEIRESVM